MINPLLVMNDSKKVWSVLGSDRKFSLTYSLCYLLIMPLIPAISWYVGLTKTGWSTGGGSLVRLTQDSGMMMVFIMYASMFSLIVVVGFSIRWMAVTYGSSMSLAKVFLFSGFVSTPFFVVGICGFYPLLWLDMTLLMVTIVWSLFLLYEGMPIVMHISQERAFMFSSAIVAAGVMGFIVVVGMSIMFWELGISPVFID